LLGRLNVGNDPICWTVSDLPAKVILKGLSCLSCLAAAGCLVAVCSCLATCASRDTTAKVTARPNPEAPRSVQSRVITATTRFTASDMSLLVVFGSACQHRRGSRVAVVESGVEIVGRTAGRGSPGSSDGRHQSRPRHSALVQSPPCRCGNDAKSVR
jgi:hypothetical protein